MLLSYIILVNTINNFDLCESPTENCRSELGFLNKYYYYYYLIIIIIIVIIIMILHVSYNYHDSLRAHAIEEKLWPLEVLIREGALYGRGCIFLFELKYPKIIQYFLLLKTEK